MELQEFAAALKRPNYLSPISAWIEHIPFAFFLVEALRPATIVELGTHRGDSYCAFCQAVDTLRLSTRCTAIDTWRGDPHVGRMDDSTLTTLRAYHDTVYSSFSRLLQSTFDDALREFPDGSIDLLHIDGTHTYDAVRNDFEAWLPKLSPRGVILMHDTQVTRDDFGVYRVWAEIAASYPSFEFRHGFGLGVLAVGREPVPAVTRFLAWANTSPDLSREFFAALGGRLLLAHSAVNVQATINRKRQHSGAIPTNFAPLVAEWFDGHDLKARASALASATRRHGRLWQRLRLAK